MSENGLNIFLGTTTNNKDLNWNPNNEKNPHLLIVGTSGSGKTVTLKSIILELKRKNIPCLILDFHDEYLEVADKVVNMRDFTINPLEVSIGRRPQDVKYEVASILKKIFNLGDQQESVVRKAIDMCYAGKRIDVVKKVDKEIIIPRFIEIRDRINQQLDNYSKSPTAPQKSTIIGLMNKLEPLFEVDIFFEENTIIPFSQIICNTTVVSLKDFPTEDVKATIAEFFLNKLIYYLYKLGHSKKIRLYAIVDEAHRLAYENSPLDRLLRESRKYGTGIILSSQRPSDFSETILANHGAIVCLQCNLEKDAKFVSKQINIEPNYIKGLIEPGLGYVKFSSDNRSHKVKIKNFEDRLTESEKKEMERKLEEGTNKIAQQSIEKEKQIESTKKSRKHRTITRSSKHKRLKKPLHKSIKKSIKNNICDACKSLNDADAFFCNECGNKLK